ncbi:hypothetical protein ACFV47_09340 [Streptomyces solisilvae]|uniref:hypothetical protein n=1 Tax=Streptomyces malaysiensis TaxID=92644 RepID=UPI0036857E0D
MTFRFTVESVNDSVSLTARPVVLHAGSDRAEPAVAIRMSGKSHVLYVPLDRIEELLAGIKDTARLAAG